MMQRKMGLVLLLFGVMLIIIFTLWLAPQNSATSETRHAVPLTPTSIPISGTVDLAPQLDTASKYKVYVRRNNGTHYLLLVAPDMPKSQLPLASGETIIQAIPPDSYFQNKVPMTIPTEDLTPSFVSPAQTRAPKPIPTGQPPYDPANDDE